MRQVRPAGLLPLVRRHVPPAPQEEVPSPEGRGRRPPAEAGPARERGHAGRGPLQDAPAPATEEEVLRYVSEEESVWGGEL